MKKHEEFNIKSELLKNHWDLIGETYAIAKEKYKNCYSENNLDEDVWKYKKVLDSLTKEWKSIYPKFVLQPIENKVFDLFYTIQTKGFEKEKNIAEEIKTFSVYYYLSQYFYIFVVPSLRNNYIYEDYPRFEIKTEDPNLLLYEIFGELWNELNENDDDEFGEFDLEEFYDIEFRSLSLFLSKCWNETKAKTGSKTIATLSDSTGAGENYFLNENRVLSDSELREIINKN